MHAGGVLSVLLYYGQKRDKTAASLREYDVVRDIEIYI